MGAGSQRAGLAVVCLAVWGCSFDSSGVPASTADLRGDVPSSAADLRVDAPPADAGGVADVRPLDLAGDTAGDTTPADLMLQDALAQDLAPGDTALPDIPPPDTVPPDSVPVTCDAKYGQVDQYVLCVETATSCEFHAKTYGATCSATCSSFGGTCLGGYDNSGDCGHMGQNDCNKSLSGQICICSK